MKKTIAKHLREKYFDAVTRELFDVDPGLTQLVNLVDRRGMQSLHHHHVLLAPIPMYLGHVKQRRSGEVTSQLRAIGGLLDQIQLVMQILVELGHHFSRLQSTTVTAEFFDPSCKHGQQRQIALDHRLNVRA